MALPWVATPRPSRLKPSPLGGRRRPPGQRAGSTLNPKLRASRVPGALAHCAPAPSVPRILYWPHLLINVVATDVTCLGMATTMCRPTYRCPWRGCGGYRWEDAVRQRGSLTSATGATRPSRRGPSWSPAKGRRYQANSNQAKGKGKGGDPKNNYSEARQGGDDKKKGQGKGKEETIQPKAAAKAEAKDGASPRPPWQTSYSMVVKPNKADPMYALRKATEAATRASGANSYQAAFVRDLEHRMQQRYEENLPAEQYYEVLT